jgi:hypothetical protein
VAAKCLGRLPCRQPAAAGATGRWAVGAGCVFTGTGAARAGHRPGARHLAHGPGHLDHGLDPAHACASPRWRGGAGGCCWA